jgi:hypothetical protein
MSQKKKLTMLYAVAGLFGLSVSLILAMLSHPKDAPFPTIDSPQAESLHEIYFAIEQYRMNNGYSPKVLSDIDGIEIGGRQGAHKFNVSDLYEISAGLKYILTTQYMPLDPKISFRQIIVAYSAAFDHPEMVRILYANGAIELKSKRDFQSEVAILDAALAQGKGS